MLRRLLHRFRDWRATRHRQIFRYHDGRRWRYGDPFALWRALFKHPAVDILDVLPAAEDGQEPQTAVALDLLCQVFGVTRWDESTRSGLTDMEILALVTQFSDYLGTLKKNTSAGQTLPQPTAWESSTAEDAPPPPTSEQSGFGSTPNGSRPAAVTQSSTQSETPQEAQSA